MDNQAMTADTPGDDQFTVPVPNPEDQMDAIRRQHGEGRHVRLPWTWDFLTEPPGIEQRIPFRTSYRSLKDGKTWCESSDPEEVAASGGDALEVLRYYAVTSGWQPWTPGEKP
jgi:hypothetical protein